MQILEIGRHPAFRLIDVPDPEPGPGEIVLRVDAVTTCPQWDLHLRHDEPMFVGHAFHYPYTLGQPGHEASGTVAAVGTGVQGLGVGDRVSAWRDAGHDRRGCYAQYAVIDAANAIPVPDRLSPVQTAAVELAMCVGATFLMLNEMGAIAGRRVGVMGLGPAGLVAAQMARAEGATEVIGFDTTASRRAFAEGRIVDRAFDPGAVSETDCPLRHGQGALLTTVDCVGAKRSVEWAMDHTTDVVALFGVQRESYEFAPYHYGWLRLCGYRGHSRAAAEYAVGLLDKGSLDLGVLVTHTLPLSQYGLGIDLLERQEAIKVCYLPW